MACEELKYESPNAEESGAKQACYRFVRNWFSGFTPSPHLTAPLPRGNIDDFYMESDRAFVY